ncbi:uncharacterized protein CTHT_0018810 [Thermochaetoides thermophila DSM 1495]|uniref:NAD(P)-binding domain-containing protein n=1 Tax=Chaetomium thermophilum (strain DSM 1495 / CBS 144.50 / IMI 039719) TaxID=759272 RepID=G0S2X2_CHATD|nr:hypothetical protein CTHT_0018810 [Thermochaetoides thermophila DSM 1495]EGS22355.1 hypothetical protein CTHT_0018810 [Thermochaetoides thermophila DSM 1495]
MTELLPSVHLLILGAGWTATFLIPLLQQRGIAFAATTTTGRTVAGVPTIPFKFDPNAPDEEITSAIGALPRARYILITFPMKGEGQSRTLVEHYLQTHPPQRGLPKARFVQLGSTGIWGQGGSTVSRSGEGKKGWGWITRHSAFDRANPRAVAEDELLLLGGCVLNLAGLWGGERHPKRWVVRVAGSKEAVRGKTSLHLIHGVDVARAILAVVDVDDEKWEKHGRGQRWLVSDGVVYDWWELLVEWAEEGQEEGKVSEQARWVWELMGEMGVLGLPREKEVLGRCLSSEEFWRTWGLVPLKARVK